MRIIKKENIIKLFFLLCALSSVATLLSIFYLLLSNGMKVFQEVSVTEFFFSSTWNPSSYKQPSYGVVSLFIGTALVTLGAMVIAIPLSVGTAAYLSDVAGKKTREIVKPIVEILASIPSVVIGFFGIIVIGPLLTKFFGISSGLNALNGMLLLAIMALPTIISVSEDALKAVPNEYKEASYALGVNKWKTLISVTIPAAFPGIVVAIMLGLGRAVGETMTVLMVTGNATALTFNFFDSMRTMTATIAIELGEVAYGTTHYYALFAIGAILFLISFMINIVAEIVVAKGRKFRS